MEFRSRPPLPPQQYHALLAKLEPLRDRLIDTSLRNRLLNYKDSVGRNLKLLPLDLGQLYSRLVNAGESLEIQGIPRQKEETNGVPAASVPAALNEDGPDSTADLCRGKLRAGETVARTEKRLATLQAQYKNCLEAFGANLMCLALGFLEWTDPDRKGEESLYAPLVLIPVQLARTPQAAETAVKAPTGEEADKAGKPARIYKYTLSYDGEDIMDNAALRLKLARLPSGPQWPEFEAEEDGGIEGYFRQIETLLRQLPQEMAGRWRIARVARLAFFSSAKEAMHRDLDAAKWPETGLVGNEWISAALDGRDKSDALPVTDDEVTHALYEEPVPTIVDADSSQMRALVRILRGDSIVIQGPPGTGKSQTITNIIATAIGSGKTVLFMSEKLASLTVVRERLGKAGLGPYCLELHSAKATPKEVLAQVNQRLRHSPRRAETPSETTSRKTRLNDHRLALTRYGEDLSHPLPGIDQAMVDAIWLKSQARDTLETVSPGLADEVPSTLVSGPPPSLLELEQLKDALRIAARLVTNGVHNAALPWHGFCPKQFPGVTTLDGIRRVLEEAVSRVRQWQDAVAALPCSACWPAGTAALHKRWTAGVGLPRVESLSPCIVQRLRHQPGEVAAYREFLVQISVWRTNGSACARRWSEQEEVSDDDFRSAAHLTSQPLWGLRADATWGDLTRQGTDLESVVSAVRTRQSMGEQLSGMFFRSGPVTILTQASTLAHLAEAVASLSHKAFHCLSPALLRPSVAPEYQAAKARAKALEQTGQDLNGRLAIDRLPENSAIGELLRTLRSTRGSLLRLIPGTKARSARKELQDLLRGEAKGTSEHEAGILLESTVAWRADVTWFQEDEELKFALGPGFKGLDTDWTSLADSISAAFLMLDVLGAESTLKVISNKLNLEPQCVVLRELAAKIHQQDEVIARLLPTLANQSLEQLREMAADTILQDLQEMKKRSDDARHKLLPLGLAPQDRLDSVPALCQETLILRDAKRRISALTADPGFLGPLPQGLLSADPAQIEPTLQWAEAVLSLEAVPIEVRCWIMEEQPLDRAELLQTKLKVLSGTVLSLQSALSKIEAFCDLESPSAALAAHNLDWTPDQILLSLEQAIGAVPSLPEWYQLREAERAIDSLRAIDFREWTKKSCLDAPTAGLAATLAFWNQHLLAISEEHPRMMSHHRVRLEEHGGQFAKIDSLSATAHLAMVDQRAFRPPCYVSQGASRGSPKTYTDLKLLNYEIKKQRSHATVRRLVHQAGKALRELMPCWMMGPQAIAQFIAPEAFTFDLLVIDEASQVRPEDALGALARTKQIVIVGDSKQMPPSNTFMALGDVPESEDDDSLSEGEEPLDKTSAALLLESILDTLKDQLPSEKLRWHYRSLHQSLIAFSNERFYDKELIIPPSRWHENAELGVRWHFVGTGRFQQRRNPAEAEQVIALMEKHVRAAVVLPEEDRESMGVVAMNAPQQDHLREKWEELCRQDPELDDARAEFEKTESLFIRNLENVQGDERDVILVSVTYDNSSQNFGLINRTGGWRRLNVLFTRARRRLHLFSSLKSTDVRMDLSQPETGKAALKGYLQFAETGHLPDTGLGQVRNVADSPFEESVARAIQGLGFELHFQVGVAGFRIDIGVLHPDHPGEYVCGIECDGALYHSHPVARDRDRIRQEVLERRGWKIYRIWSTDWFRNRTEEIDRLRRYLQTASS